MNLPLPQLFYWGSRPKTLRHHLRWQKFLQQITIKQQRQGSPHRACCSSNLSTHSSKSQSCSWSGCQIHPLVGTEHRAASPTRCALEFARAMPALRLPSLAPSGLKIPSTEHLHARYLQRCSRTQGFPPDLHFQSVPSTSRGFIPPHQDGSWRQWANFLPWQAGAWWPHTWAVAQGALTEPREQQFHKEATSASNCGASVLLFLTLEWSPSASEVPHPQRSCSGSWAFLKTHTEV